MTIYPLRTGYCDLPGIDALGRAGFNAKWRSKAFAVIVSGALFVEIRQCAQKFA